MCVEKVPCMVFYSKKKMRVWNVSQTMWDSFQNQTLMQKNLPFIVSGTLACIHMPVYAYACMKHVHSNLEHACAYACMRMYVHMP